MLRKLFLTLVLLALALVVLPPLWFTLFPEAAAPDLPPPGVRVTLESGVGVNVIESGSGAPVVLIHGLPGSAYDWRALGVELASRGRRALAYDRVGYGRSDPRPTGSPHTVDQNARELVELLEALDVRDATAVGWSYGGVVALVAAMGGEERISRLVLVGSGGPDSPDAQRPEPPALMRLLYSDPVLAWRARVPPLGRILMVTISDAAFSGGPQPDWWLPSVRANFARRETTLAYRGEMFGVGAPEAEQAAFDLARVAVPVLIVHGDDDRLAPIAIARYLHQEIRGSELREIERGSHMLPVTHAPLLADAIAGFEGR